jgi:hypothetical protein
MAEPYKEFVTVECLEGEIEYIFNPEQFFREY